MFDFLLNNTPLLYWTQSLWRDEAFSVWISETSIFEAINRTIGDFNPPLYYILLHLWMRLVGTSEIALRGLSVVFFLLFLITVYVFAKKVFNSERSAQITTLLAGVNPMLLYFAFELRMYSLFTLLATVSMYFFYTRTWLFYVITTALGLYTQPFMAFVVISQMSYLLYRRQLKLIVFLCGALTVLYLPWLVILIRQFTQSGPMWMYPVDLTTILSAFGNLYLGYEGTPGGLWPVMQLISVLFLVLLWKIWRAKSLHDETKLFTSWLCIPLILVLGISLVKPIYVHRYVLFVSVAEVFILGVYLHLIRNHRWAGLVTVGIIGTTLLANFFTPQFHRKVPIRDTFSTINPLLKTGDVVYAATPLVYFESRYYTKGETTVFLYNPQRQTPPKYVGSGGMPESTWAITYPLYPKRAFMIFEDGSYKIVQTGVY